MSTFLSRPQGAAPAESTATARARRRRRARCRGPSIQGRSPVLIEARKGVLVAAGGFGHNAEMRRKYSGNQPNEAQWSGANPGDTGEALEAMMRLGAKTDLLDEAWWLPCSRRPGSARSTSGMARQRPGTDLRRRRRPAVLQRIELVRRGGQGDVRERRVPCWLIFDEGCCRRATCRSGGRLPGRPVTGGAFASGHGPESRHHRGVGRRCRCGCPDAGNHRWTRFNARRGRKASIPTSDGDRSAYNRGPGDPAHKPNLSLGPIDRATTNVTEIYPGGRRDVRRVDDERARGGARRERLHRSRGCT